MKHDVFISYSFADQTIADRVLNTLINTYRIHPWICTRDIGGGVDYKKEIVRAIRECKVFVFLQSKNSVASDQVPREVGIALKFGKTVIPFIVEESELEDELLYDLVQTQWIDATKPPLEIKIGELAESILTVIGTDTAEAEETLIPKLNSRMTTVKPVFAGREIIMDSIEEVFTSGQRIVILHGMGGIGKTEIAIQYARKHREEFKTVVVARYENSLAETISDDELFSISGFARKIKANGNLQTDEEYARDKLAYMTRYCGKDTLIVLDNYDTDSDPLFSNIAERGEYRLLVTTRNDQKEISRYPVIEVREVDDKALKEMFIAYANPKYTSFEEDDPAFPELFDLTARHTLTLEFVAQMAEELGCFDISEVVNELKRQGLTTALGKVDGARDSMATLIRNITLNEEEKAFLMYMQLMPNAGIERHYFRRWCQLDVYQSFNRLVRRSVVRFDPRTGTLSLHPIVREVLKEEIPPIFTTCQSFLTSFTNDIADYLSWNYPTETKKQYYNCCESILNCFNTINNETYPLYCCIGDYYSFSGLCGNVEGLLNSLMGKAADLYGIESLEFSIPRFFLGRCKKMRLRLHEAKDILEQSQKYFSKHLNEDSCGFHIRDLFIRCCNDLAGLYMDLSRSKVQSGGGGLHSFMDKARSVLDEASIALSDYNSADKVIYGCRKGLILYMGARRLMEESQPDCDILQMLLQADESYYGEAKTDHAMIKNRISSVYYKSGEYERALAYTEEAMNGYILSNELGSVGLLGDRVCRLYLQRAKCFIRLHKAHEAFEALRKTLEVIDKVYEKRNDEYHILVEEVSRELCDYLKKVFNLSVAISNDYSLLISTLDDICSLETLSPQGVEDCIKN